ncbi:sulfatase [Chloroflexota bacterium]
MATEKDKATDRLGFKATIAIAGLVGLIGGGLFGVWDVLTVTFGQITLFSFREMFFFVLYSVALYAVIGWLGIIAIGVISSGVINSGKYRVNKSQLTGVFAGVFVLLAVYVLLASKIIAGSTFDIIESTVISLLSGTAAAGIAMYVLDKVTWGEKRIATGVSLVVSLLVLSCSVLWVNLSLLSEETFFKPLSLLPNIVLLLLVCFLAVGLYKLPLFIRQRYEPRRRREAGYILLAVVLCAFITISFIGPFGFENTQKAGTSAAGEIRTPVDLENLKGKPNVLWIVMDTVRADHLSGYGYHQNTTPNLDRIAREGVLFENAISTAPWTQPSHGSMFTGMFPSKHGIDAEHQWLDDDFQTIAELLRWHGYQTFGYSNNPGVSPKSNLSQGFDTFEVTSMGESPLGSELADSLKVNTIRRYVQAVLRQDDGARRTNEVVEKWIADAYQAEAPFFAFINYMEAHNPYHPPGPYVMPYLGEHVDLAEARRVTQNYVSYIAGTVPMSDDDFDLLRALYDGELSYLDFRIGQLLDYMRELDILDSTVLIITSDHGENFGDHQLMDHMLCVYDTLLHVPLIIRYPELFEAGLRVDKQVQQTDIFPTILDIVDIKSDDEEHIQGHSLLTDGQEPESTLVIAEHAIWHNILHNLTNENPQLDVSKYSRYLKTVRTDEFKYIWASNGRDELYDIRHDPEELNNLIEAEPGKAGELRALLREWLHSFEPYRSGTAQQVP